MQGKVWVPETSGRAYIGRTVPRTEVGTDWAEVSQGGTVGAAGGYINTNAMMHPRLLDQNGVAKCTIEGNKRRRA